MGFPRHEYWSGLLFPSTGDLPDPGLKPVSSALQANSLLLSPWRSPYVTFILPKKKKQTPKETKTQLSFPATLIK